jgi:UDP-N-acetyl-D-galactosamine dehydrogenase
MTWCTAGVASLDGASDQCLEDTMDQATNSSQIQSPFRIVVVGLGYVGLPLAVALARRFPTAGYDIDASRIEELRAGHDRTREIASAVLKDSTLVITGALDRCRGANIYIVTVPTPVTAGNTPDLSFVRDATRSVGTLLEAGRGQIVVYESTVYPGVTEEICGPLLEEVSGLAAGRDFFLGYSPERTNPGDRQHTLDRVTKVVAGQTPQVAATLAEIYGAITSAGVFRAKSIKVAEAAKVIENAQRDINIAFINEVTMIFQRLGLSVYDVLDTAATKWNFLTFSPGLVGGHCIGVDPYYLSYRAQELGHRPEIILAGRQINDGMGQYIADRVHNVLRHPARVLVLGLTFKENVPDLRNSKVVDMIARLKWLGHDVAVCDPLAHPEEARREYELEVCSKLPSGVFDPFDAVIGAVPHASYAALSAADLCGLLKPEGLLADIKGMWRQLVLPGGVRRWQM